MAEIKVKLPEGVVQRVDLDNPLLVLEGYLETVTPTPPPPPGTIVFPPGDIVTKATRGRPFGIPWSRLARWEPFFTEAGERHGVAPILMVPIAVIEGGGNHYVTGRTTGTRDEVITRGQDSIDDVPAIGMMQVKCGFHNNTAACWTPRGNIDTATRLMASFMRELGTWERAITERYHPGDDPGSGWTRAEYVRAMREMILEIKAVQPAPAPGPFPSLPYRVAHIPRGNPNRPGDIINPSWITVHETGNTRPGTDAENHRVFTHQGGGPETVSFHLVVDDHEAIELLPFTEKGWHAGDGCDDPVQDIGCFKSVAIETCVNADGDWDRTFDNLSTLIARIIRSDSRFSVERIAQHNRWSGKNCPARIRAQGTWERLLADVRRKLG